jgi:hypothetical protein
MDFHGDVAAHQAPGSAGAEFAAEAGTSAGRSARPQEFVGGTVGAAHL